MARSNTLKSKDIARMIQNGRPFRSRSFLVFSEAIDDVQSNCSETAVPLGKVAFIAPKRLGNAVLRNRYKRLLRAAFDQAVQESGNHHICDKNNIIYMAGDKIAKQSFQDVVCEMNATFAKISKKNASACSNKIGKRSTL